MACIEYDAIHAMYAAFPTAIIATKGSFFWLECSFDILWHNCVPS
jgi:hypothetical protein